MVLPTGVRLLCQPIDSVRSVAVGVWVEAGGIFESTAEGGVAHLLEHLMFKGTEKRDARQIARAIEGRGGHLGAFTEKEFCCYYAVVLDDHLPLAIDVLADIITNHRYDDEQLAREQGVVLEEISDLEDSPGDYVHELLAHGLWPDHPMGASVLGTRESVGALDRQGVRRFWQNHYGPSTTTVAVAGRFAREELMSLVRDELVFSWDGVQPAPLPSLPKGMTRTVVEERQLGQVHLAFGARSDGVVAETRFPMLVLNAALGGGMGSRLFQVIREDHGLAYAVYSHLSQTRSTGFLCVYLATDPSRLDAASGLLSAELASICTHGITEEELQEAKEQIKGALVLSQESTSARMTRLATHELYFGRFYDLDESLALIDKVSGNEVLETARRLFWEQEPVAALVGPVRGEPAGLRDALTASKSVGAPR